MKKRFKYFSVLACISFFSCVTTYRINDSEYLYFPYSENEKLVFHSNDGRIDTLQLNSFSEWSKPRPYPRLSLGGNRFEHFGYVLSHSINSKQKILPDFHIELGAFNWKGTWIEIRTESDHYLYINRTRLPLKEFDSLPRQKFQTNTKEYNDVIKIEGAKKGHKGKFNIDYFYWSKSKGIIGWEDEIAQWKLVD